MVHHQEPTGGRHSSHLSADPGVEGFQFLDVGGRVRLVNAGARGISRHQSIADVGDVGDDIHRVEPPVRIDGQRLAVVRLAGLGHAGSKPGRDGDDAGVAARVGDRLEQRSFEPAAVDDEHVAACDGG